jgi:hypothetical protein
MCTACEQFTKCEDCAPVLDECPHCGDKAFDHDDTAHTEELYCYKDLSDDDGKDATVVLDDNGKDATVAKDDDNNYDDVSVAVVQFKREAEAAKKERHP